MNWERSCSPAHERSMQGCRLSNILPWKVLGLLSVLQRTCWWVSKVWFLEEICFLFSSPCILNFVFLFLWGERGAWWRTASATLPPMPCGAGDKRKEEKRRERRRQAVKTDRNGWATGGEGGGRRTLLPKGWGVLPAVSTKCHTDQTLRAWFMERGIFCWATCRQAINLITENTEVLRLPRPGGTGSLHGDHSLSKHSPVSSSPSAAATDAAGDSGWSTFLRAGLPVCAPVCGKALCDRGQRPRRRNARQRALYQRSAFESKHMQTVSEPSTHLCYVVYLPTH